MLTFLVTESPNEGQVSNTQGQTMTYHQPPVRENETHSIFVFDRYPFGRREKREAIV
jgi:hypothetical protein